MCKNSLCFKHHPQTIQFSSTLTLIAQSLELKAYIFDPLLSSTVVIVISSVYVCKHFFYFFDPTFPLCVCVEECTHSVQVFSVLSLQYETISSSVVCKWSIS